MKTSKSQVKDDIFKGNNNITIDAKHREINNYFKNKKKNLPELENQLQELIIKYKSFENECLEKKKYLKQIRELKINIKNIKSDKDEIDYYLNVGNILNSYYENSSLDNRNKDKKDNANNKNKKELKEKKKKSKKEVVNDNPITNFFGVQDNNNQDNSQDNSQYNSQNNNQVNNQNNNQVINNTRREQTLDDYNLINTNNEFRKGDLLRNYMKKIDDDYINPKLETKIKTDWCNSCNNEMSICQTDGTLVCKKCGFTKTIVIDTDKKNFKDPPPVVSYFAYQRINHFNELIAQYQGKESTEIPQEVFDKIMIEIKKERITDLTKITPLKIKSYLKKLKLNKYYEHIAYIITRLNGVAPPKLPKELEDKLRSMFKEIQAPFNKFCPKDRKNLLYYPYILHKFVELLGVDHIYKFSVLKNRDKLYKHDQLWEKICNELGWEFIKSC